jgi:ribosomal protein S25
MLMNLGLAPIPPVPAIQKPGKPKRARAARSKTGLSREEVSRAHLIIAHARNLERAEGDRRSALDYIRGEKCVTVRAMALRFEWSHSKAEDVMQILKGRGQVEKIGANKSGIWGPVCQS